MASGYSPWIYRKILYRIPFLFKKCPQGNYHKRWHRLCFCGLHMCSGDWHGGIYDFKTKKQYQTDDEYQRILSQWAELHEKYIIKPRDAGFAPISASQYYCRKHGNKTTIQSAFLAGVKWANPGADVSLKGHRVNA